MSSFNESVGLGYLKTNALEFVKYPLSLLLYFSRQYINLLQMWNAGFLMGGSEAKVTCVKS